MSSDAIHLKEAHALLSAVKHLSRNRLSHGLRCSVLSDSMCVVLAASKGRASNSCLNRFCQRIAAEVLACGLQLRVRWIPSEWNTSDQGSRVWEFLRGEPFKGLAHVAPHAVRAASSAHAARRARAAEEKACGRGSSVDLVGAGGGESRPAAEPRASDPSDGEASFCTAFSEPDWADSPRGPHGGEEEAECAPVISPAEPTTEVCRARRLARGSALARRRRCRL